jgi:uncharacterized protein
MKILIAGGTGFVGRHLIPHLNKRHEIFVIGRDKNKIKKHFANKVMAYEWDSLTSINPNDVDVIINLCGKNIANSRWSELIKNKIINSRVSTCKQLLSWATPAKDSIRFYCANGISIYGMQQVDDKNHLTEQAPIAFECPPDFLTEVAVKWLKAANMSQITTTIMHFGVVLKKKEGFLKKLSPSFYFGLGSIIGSGKQGISWIHINDLINAIEFLLNHPNLNGSFNLCAPNPVSQEQFAKRLAHSMNRPLLMTIPAIIIKTLLGEMGEYLILKGQRVIPERLIDSGFTFEYPTIKQALEHEFQL